MVKKPDFPGVIRIVHMTSGHFLIAAVKGVYRARANMLNQLRRSEHSNKPLQVLFDTSQDVKFQLFLTADLADARMLKQEWVEEGKRNMPSLLLNVAAKASSSPGHVWKTPEYRAVDEMVAVPVERVIKPTLTKNLHYQQPVEIEGVEYNNIYVVARALHLDAPTVFKRLLSDNERWAYWNFKDPSCLLPLPTSSVSPSRQTA